MVDCSEPLLSRAAFIEVFSHNKGKDTKRSLYKNYKIATLDSWLFYIYSAFKADLYKEKLEHSDPEGYV